MRYRYLLFDFDGTLADSMHVFVSCWNAVAPRYGFQPMDPGRLDDYRGLGARQLMKRLDMPLWRVPAVSLEMRRMMRDRAHEVRLFPGVTSVLPALAAAGVRNGLVTSNSRENVERILDPASLGALSYFGCGLSIFGKKRKFREFLQETGVAPAEVLCVGDEVRDGEAARAVGMHFAGVAWGFASAAALQPLSTHPLLSTLEELPDLVL